MTGRLGFIFTLLSFLVPLSGQADSNYHPPLDIPMFLSGNFGEIRPDHFHSGIDIKTQGHTGFPVSSIADGYVSRIKVQANGYGKSLYITHPDGHTSQYGHLDRYTEAIAKYVKEVQYKRRSHQVDIYPPADKFKVSSGQLIAYSGNSGSSMGPHLHFEIRSTAKQHPLNVLKYDFEIKDSQAPRFMGLYITPLDVASGFNGNNSMARMELVKDQGIYTVAWGTRMEIAGNFGLGVEVFDFLDGSHNRCGIYSLELHAGGKQIYSHRMDEFAFSESHFVNACTDYQEAVLNGKKVHRLYRLPGDRLRIYGSLENDGRMQLAPGEELPIRIVALDVAGNQSVLEVLLKGSSSAQPPADDKKDPHATVDHSREFRIARGEADLLIPAHALYEDTPIAFEREENPLAFMGMAYRVHDEATPFHGSCKLTIELPFMEKMLRSKLLLAKKDNKGEWNSAGGKINGEYLEVSLKSFGNYLLCLDTLAPEIKPHQPMKENDYRGQKRMAYIIHDELSGIKSYEGFIDNNWVLFEYDPKNDLLSYAFDTTRLSKGMEHELELYVKDERGNLSLYHSTFKW